MSGDALSLPTGVFVDALHHKIYWTDVVVSNQMWVATISDLANPTTPTKQTQLMSNGNLRFPMGLSIVTTNMSDAPCALTFSNLRGGPVCTDSFFDISRVDNAHCVLTFNGSDYVSDFTSGSHSITVQAPSVAGTYPINFFGQNLLHSDDSDIRSANVIVDTRVSDFLIVISQSDNICAGKTVSLTVTSAISDAGYYIVQDDGLLSLFQPTISFSPTQTSDYKVTVFSRHGACSSDVFIHIVVSSDTPVSDIGIKASSDVVCSGNPVTLTATSNADHYLWFDGSSDISLTFIPPETGDYPVTGYSQNYVCIGVSSKHITVKTPVILDAGSDQTIEAESDAVIGVGPALSDVLYIWSPSDGISDVHAFPTTAHPSTTTTYTVTAQRMDVSDCASSDSIVITVAGEPVPAPQTEPGNFNVKAVGSLMDFTLVLPPELSSQISDTSDVHAVFSDICVFADTLDCHGFLAGLTINISSDVFCSDSVILQRPEIVLVSCSDNVFYMNDDDGHFTFSITDFMSDTMLVQYSDALCQVSDVMTLIGGSFSLQVSDEKFVWVSPCSSDMPITSTPVFSHPLLAIDAQGQITDIGPIDGAQLCHNPSSDTSYVCKIKSHTIALGDFLDTHFSDYTSHISDRQTLLYQGPLRAERVKVDFDRVQLIFHDITAPCSDCGCPC